MIKIKNKALDGYTVSKENGKEFLSINNSWVIIDVGRKEGTISIQCCCGSERIVDIPEEALISACQCGRKTLINKMG